MALDPVKNFAKVTVSGGYDASATSINLVTGDGAKLPDPATDGEFNLTWWDWTNYKDPSDDPNVEIVRCTARSSDTVTVIRGQEGTSATNKNTSGSTYLMLLTPTKKLIDDINSHITDTSNPHNVTAAQVGAITEVADDTTPQLGGDLDCQNKDLQNVALAEYNAIYDNGNSGTSKTIDWNNGNKQKITLTGNCTLSFTAPSGPCSLQLIVIQDGTGGRTLTYPASVKWAGGSAPTLTSDANAVDIISFLYDGSNYYGVASLNFS